MNFVLKTEDLTKRYGGKTVLNHWTMEIARGEIYGLIGRNGAGKTTLLKTILGMCHPDEGNIWYFDGESPETARHHIGSLIEAPGLYRSCTARENMRRFAILFGGDEAEIDELLALVGLTHAGQKKVAQFSLGMKQRLGIAVALLGHPDILLLDEPVNGLDPEGIRDIRDLILRLNRERGVTFLISSHLLDELSRVATRYGIIARGRMVEEITAGELEARCRSALKITVDDPEKALALLADAYPDMPREVEGNALLLPPDTDANAVNALLCAGGVQISELVVRHDRVEDYFLARLGRDIQAARQ